MLVGRPESLLKSLFALDKRAVGLTVLTTKININKDKINENVNKC